jgi:tight adherence protein C
MIDILASGGIAGLGVTLIYVGLRPPRRALGQVLDGLRRPVEDRPVGRARVYQLAAEPARSLGLPRRQVRLDLEIMQKDHAQHLTEQTLAVLVGGLLLPMAATLAGMSGQVPLWLALVGGAIGFRWADANLHAQAQQRREQLRHTLSLMLTLLTISLARGAGIEQALGEASTVCTGPGADRLRQVLGAARRLRRPPWQDLGKLGKKTGVTELTELAASMSLAGSEGARIRSSLSARAAAMRQAATAQAETEAEKSSSRMAVPLLILGIAYLIFLLYPPLAGIGQTI